jgi:hypothetical protein
MEVKELVDSLNELATARWNTHFGEAGTLGEKKLWNHKRGDKGSQIVGDDHEAGIGEGVFGDPLGDLI